MGGESLLRGSDPAWMDLPMAAKKTRKPKKTTGKQAAKPSRRPAARATSGARPTKGKPGRPKPKIKARPGPKASRPALKAKAKAKGRGVPRTKLKTRPRPKPRGSAWCARS